MAQGVFRPRTPRDVFIIFQCAVTQPTLLDGSHPGISYQLTPLLSGQETPCPRQNACKGPNPLSDPNLYNERHQGTNWPPKCHWSNTSAPCLIQNGEWHTVAPKEGTAGQLQAVPILFVYCWVGESRDSRK